MVHSGRLVARHAPASVIATWKDFLWPMLVLQDPQVQTLSVALSRLTINSQVSLNELMAGLVIANLPMIVVFLIFQRSILSGLSAGALKSDLCPHQTANGGATR